MTEIYTLGQFQSPIKSFSSGSRLVLNDFSVVSGVAGGEFWLERGESCPWIGCGLSIAQGKQAVGYSTFLSQ